jgi:hypothetical protein
MNELPAGGVLILIALGAVALLILVSRFGKLLGRFLLILGGIGAVVVVGLAFLSQGAANLQTARVAQEAAQAVEVASVGQTISNLGLALGLGVTSALLVLAVGLNLWQAWRLRDARRGRWASGPNALWGRVGGDPSVPTMAGTEMWTALLMSQMMMTLQQTLAGLYTGSGIRRRPWTGGGGRRGFVHEPLPFPSGDGEWDEWDEDPWVLGDGREEEELWGVP